MITTRDGVQCKRGDKVWEVATDIHSGKYGPVRSIVDGGSNDVANPDMCWSSYDLCKEQCDKLNGGEMTFSEYIASGQHEKMSDMGKLLFGQ